MIKVLFVCHGNICRSPMAQFVFQDMVNRQGLQNQFHIDSAATSREEIGNPPHYGTVRKMKEQHIPILAHHAVQITRKDGQTFDYIIGMDRCNIRDIERILGSHAHGKVYRLLDFSGCPRDIADPWYTGDFDLTYRDVVEGCQGFFQWLKETTKDGRFFADAKRGLL